MQASVPELTKRSFSTEGKQCVTSSARSASAAMRRSEARALCCGLLDGLDDGRKGVAEDHRAPGAEEVEVAIAVFVEEVGALGVGDEGWVAAYGAEGTDGRVDAAGEKFLGAKLQVAGVGEGAGHVFSIGWRGCPVPDGEEHLWTVLKVGFGICHR